MTSHNNIIFRQTDVWIQASPSDDDGSTLTSNRLSSELSSLGTLPVVMVTTSTATYQIPVEWESVSKPMYMSYFSDSLCMSRAHKVLTSFVYAKS